MQFWSELNVFLIYREICRELKKKHPPKRVRIGQSSLLTPAYNIESSVFKLNRTASILEFELVKLSSMEILFDFVRCDMPNTREGRLSRNAV